MVAKERQGHWGNKKEPVVKDSGQAEGPAGET